MEIDDVIWVLYNGLLNKEPIINESKEFKGFSLLKKIFKDDEFIIPDKKTDGFISFNSTNIKGLDSFNNKLILFFNGSPHNLRLLVIYLIDFFISYFESLKHKKYCPKFFVEKNRSLKLDLPPIPYIDGCKDYLYLFNLKLICNYSMNYRDWIEIFFKLDIFLRNNNTNLDFMKFNSSTNSSILKLRDFSTNNQDTISSGYLNILGNYNIIQNFPYISLMANGLKLIRKIETKKVGEIYIKYAMSVLSEDSNKLDETTEKVKNNIELRFITTIYCLISLSIYSGKIDNAIVYISTAQRLLRSNQKTLSSSLITMLNIYVLLTKLHILLNAVEERENLIFNSVPRNNIANLNLLVTNTFLDIRNEVIENSVKMNNIQCINLLKHITDCVNYIIEGFPIMSSLNQINKELFNTEITATYNFCLSKLDSIYTIESGPQILMEAHDLFSFLIEEKMSFKNKNVILRIHSSICWGSVIPNMLLMMSDEITYKYSKDFSSIYFVQLAEQLISYTRLMCELPVEENKCTLSRCDLAETYLFVALYLYFGRDDFVKSGEFIRYGKDILSPFNCSFEVCSIYCILLYLEFIISARISLDEPKLESILTDIVHFGKKSLYIMPVKEKEVSYRRKLINYSVIQGYTLLSLLKNNCNLMSNEEVEFLTNIKNSNEFDKSNRLNSEDNIILSNYLNIVDELKAVLEK
ncbi:hypothetical protein FG386_001629 [Cryptosporidium ryanae]|uniref:uncharacterized protein n=1 Tax=Cryptosporidium ryanae TaxID=515981 RepID=UPI00351A0D5C|nr:hypothetical protein FG386_001629 [Cryptosporidium ryanae]